MGEKVYELRKVKKKGRGMPLIGDKFPEMEVQTTHGLMRLPDQFSGKWFILFSHPADFTPVCTTEFVAFQEVYPELRELDCELVGLSVDQVFSHIKWIEWIEENLDTEIEFPVIADTGRVADTLGLIHPARPTNTVRAVFVVDPEGIIRAILYYPQELGRNIPEIVRMIRAFRVIDAEGVAAPANWPDNQLIGDHVIVPPASDIETARKRKEEYECYDWWLCHRSTGGD
ncbi:peroxiredoxin [Methanothermobacter sp.]|uniref:peroxiredoxin n=1 Tax=Methanothermobacter sp. TaxID=1884223 RepID=UPI003C72E21C